MQSTTTQGQAIEQARQDWERMKEQAAIHAIGAALIPFPLTAYLSDEQTATLLNLGRCTAEAARLRTVYRQLVAASTPNPGTERWG